MRVVETVQELQRLADAERAAGRRLALVPTMGALHEGHLSLVRAARRRADRVWLSIFVNPSQFDEAADLAGYPRRLREDLAACHGAGVDLVFAPPASEMYPPGSQTWVEVTELARPLCGASRPGHFRGVTTVVGASTVREHDGLALSSRNLRLDPEARRQARVLVGALDAAERAVAAGERGAAALLHLVSNEIGKAPRARIDYAELRDPESLEAAPPVLDGSTLLALAVCFAPREEGEDAVVRLIDNRVLHPTLSTREGSRVFVDAGNRPREID
jgi:pantoate--beta-alanine ligase